jgi:hypothetical protein
MESSKRTLTGVVTMRLNMVLLTTTVYYGAGENANAIVAAQTISALYDGWGGRVMGIASAGLEAA